jgi:hypothetical protein
LPSVYVSVGGLAVAIRHYLQRDLALSSAPDAAIEDQFGRFPRLDAAAARAAGFVDDGDVSGLVANVFERMVRQ